jgi:hypothetical protein
MVIARVEGMYNAALSGPPPFFETASFELQKGDKKKARSAFANDLAYSPETSFVFGDRDVESVFNEELNDEDCAILYRENDESSDETTRSDFYADHVWQAFTKTTLQNNEEEADSSSAEGDTK